MGSQFLFRSTNPETLRHFKEMLGTRSKKQTSRSIQDFSFKTSKTFSDTDKDIINNENILNFEPGMVWGVIAEGNNRLIEADKINGNHYMKKHNDIVFSLTSSNDDLSVYNRVYQDVKYLIRSNKVEAPKKFNL